MGNERAAIGGNNPPDPIDEALAPYMDAIDEAENWLDGEAVESEEAMKAVDALIKDVRAAKGAVAKAKKSATAPLYDAWKAEGARWKPTEDDIERRLKGLAAVVDPFKRKLAEEKEDAKRKAYEEARAKERAAEEAAAKANAASYEEQVEADRLKAEAMRAKEAASAANKDKVKGLRTVHKHEVDDYKAAINWIARNDREAMCAFIDEYVRKHCRDKDISGVNTWTEKEAY